MLHRGCPCRVMGARAGGHLCSLKGRASRWDSWGQSRHQPKGPRALCNWGCPSKLLKQKWCGPGVFGNASHLCPLGTAAGAVVRAIWGCAGVNLPGSSLVRLLGLVGASGLGLTDVVH